MSRPPAPHDPSGPPNQRPRFVTGRLLAGRYEILERVGEGGTAEVFRARDHRLDRVVAVKVLRPQYGQDSDARARFAVEARSAAALAVPNIVPVYDFGAADEGSLFIVMRFIDGPSLRRVLAERGALPPAEVVRIGRQVAQALAGAHDHGLIHRDVKPGNILIDASGAAHLTDFGIVKALAGADDLTRTGMTHGTAAYLSPEQATGGAVDPRTDLYSLGVVLYEALAGRPPFAGEDAVAVSYRHAHEAPQALAAAAPGLDPELERLVMRCLEKDPARRPASAQEVVAALSAIEARLAATGPAEAAPAATAAAGVFGSAPAGEPRGHESETVQMTAAPHEAPTAAWPATVAAAPESRAGGTATIVAPAHPVYQPPVQRGVAAVRPARRDRPARRGGTALGATVLFLAAALVVLLAAVALPALLPDRDGGIGAAPPTATPIRRPAATEQAVIPPPVPVPSASATPAATLPSEPPTPTPAPTPDPTPTPESTPPPRPPAENVSARIPDRLFEGDYDGQGSGRYHDRSASWVYGQGTPYHTMTANFRLTHDGEVRPRASLVVVGLDGDNPRKNAMAVIFNGVTIYQGPNPLPNDDCCGPSGPGNWGSATFDVPGELIGRDNTLTISNLEAGDCTLCPEYVMVDYAVLEYRVRP